VTVGDGEAVRCGVPDEADDVADLAVVPDAAEAHPAPGWWKLAGHVTPIIGCEL
jgi:hypothetical protein